MKTSLKTIVSVKTGVFLKPGPQANGYYIQAKDVDSANGLLFPRVQNLSFTHSLQKHLLRPGDVLFVAKGDYHPAVTFKGSPYPVVPSTSFLVLKILPGANLLPEYLTWFLNLPQTQTRLKTFAKGTDIASISISILAQLNVDVPAIETQKQILRLQQLRNKEMELNAAIDTLNEQLLQHQLLQAAKGK